MATFTYSSESCVVSSVRTNFQPMHELALHQSACYLLAIHACKSKKRAAKYIASAKKQPFMNFNLLHNIVRMRTQSHVCENPISFS